MLNIRRLIEKLSLTILIKNIFYCLRIFFLFNKKKKKYIYIYIFFFFSLIKKFKVFFIKKYFVIYIYFFFLSTKLNAFATRGFIFLVKLKPAAVGFQKRGLICWVDKHVVCLVCR